ncbi:Alpha/Beta hydrolase protein [Mycena galopus ATCC 62051]|nr:Alpha/Beta hydrolase protein [Mycena galopus ATCC 62051]
MYRALSEIPVPTSAHFVNDVVQLYSSAKDNVRDIKRSLSTAIFVGSPNVLVAPAVDMGDVIASIAAPSGSFCFLHRAVLRETAENKRRYIEIWVGDVLAVSKDVTEAHGSFYSDEFFSAVSFSPFELAFMYVAEANGPTEALEKFKFVPHIGEGQAGKKRPTIFIFRWDTSTIPCQTSLASTSPVLPEDHPILFGQPVFSPLDKKKIYCTSYEYTRDGRLLGVRWCNNRPSGIWALTLPTTSEDMADGAVASLRCAAQKLTPSHLSCRSPRVYLDAAKNATLFWLSAASGGPHAGTFSLHASDLTAPQVKSQVLVDTIWQPRESDGFPGLYLDSNLPVSPFITIHEEVFLVFSSTWGSRDTVLSVSAADGVVKDLTPDSDGKLYSWTMLATDGNNRLVCSRSAPTIPHEFVLGEVNSRGQASWRVIHSPYILPSLKTALSDLTYSVVSIPGRGRTETVIVGRSRPEPTPPPCIQFIHGGPHGVTTTAFVPSIAFLALEGYTISLPNYTGSVGFGETAIRALLGNCGTLDVQDCIATVRHLVSSGLSVEGKGKQFLIGGSHGGFLAAHLIGQFPDVFTAAVIRNPVITTDPMSSDIPDWYFNEWNIAYPMSSAPEGYPAATNGDRSLPPRRTPAESQGILSSSSIEYVDAVTAHVLLHLGGADLRVTPTHGLEYYHALKGKARNERPEQGVEMHWFEKEDHSLAGVEASRIVSETSRDWFNRYRT